MERIWEKILREGGATVHFQKMLRQTTLLDDAQRRPNDMRRIDILATGLPFFLGRPLLCDATVRSPISGRGVAYPGAHCENGVALKRAEQQN